MYWEVGNYVNSVVLAGNRAEYGKQIVSTLSKQLIAKFGQTFDIQNLRRMMRFAERFNDFEIVSTLSKLLSWSHFAEILTQKSYEARLYYANDSAQRSLSIRKTTSFQDERCCVLPGRPLYQGRSGYQAGRLPNGTVPATGRARVQWPSHAVAAPTVLWGDG